MSDIPIPPAPGQPEPPPAATIVVTGTRTERELELERELETERKIRKDREVTLAHFQDENHRLKTVTQPPPAKKSAPWTFFEDEED